MMPDEVTAIIAKVLFVLSASCVLLMARVRASEVKCPQLNLAPVSTTLN